MKALSIRQPWPYAIFNLGKDIENRSWRTHYRGPLLIHASKSKRADDFEEAFAFFDEILPLDEGERLRRRSRIRDEAGLGGIVGVALVVDCVEASTSPWFFGRFGIVLAKPRPIPLIPYTGARGLFDVPEDVARQAMAAADAYGRARAA